MPGGKAVVRRPAPPAWPPCLALALAAAFTSTSLRDRCREPGEPDDLELAGTTEKKHKNLEFNNNYSYIVISAYKCIFLMKK